MLAPSPHQARQNPNTRPKAITYVDFLLPILTVSSLLGGKSFRIITATACTYPEADIPIRNRNDQVLQTASFPFPTQPAQEAEIWSCAAFPAPPAMCSVALKKGLHPGAGLGQARVTVDTEPSAVHIKGVWFSSGNRFTYKVETSCRTTHLPYGKALNF